MTKPLSEQKKRELKLMAAIIVESAVDVEKDARKRHTKRLEVGTKPG